MKTKRILATLALAATVFTTSCAEPATLLPFISSDSDGLNLDGTKISWAWAKGNVENGYYELGTPQYDILMERIDEIEKKYNCGIEALINEDLPMWQAPWGSLCTSYGILITELQKYGLKAGSKGKKKTARKGRFSEKSAA